MKTKILSILALSVLFISQAFAQKDAISIGPVTVGAPEFKIKVSGGDDQVVSQNAPLGATLPAVNLVVEGVSGSGSAYGVVVELNGNLEAVESVSLVNGGDELLSTRKVQRRLVLGREFWLGEGSRWNFTVFVTMRDSLPTWSNPSDASGQRFSVRVVSVLTNAKVEGFLPSGPQHTVNLSQQIGRVAVRQFAVQEQNLLPYLSHRWIFAVELSGNSIEEESLPWVAINLYANGGSVGDITVILADGNGVLLAGPNGVEESQEEAEKGTVHFRWPNNLEKGAKKAVYVGVRLGHSWIRGGTVSASMVPSHSVAQGSLYGYRSALLPHAVLAGQVFTVKPIAEKYEVKQFSIPTPLVAGRNDLVRFSVTAPPDKDLIIPGFALRVGWLPVEDDYDGVMLYGYADNAFSVPLAGLQRDGAFHPRVWSIRGNQHFSGFDIPVVNGNENQYQSSGIHLPPGQTGYFAARADFVPSGFFSAVGVIIAESRTWQPLAIQIRSR